MFKNVMWQIVTCMMVMLKILICQIVYVTCKIATFHVLTCKIVLLTCHIVICKILMLFVSFARKKTFP